MRMYPKSHKESPLGLQLVIELEKHLLAPPRSEEEESLPFEYTPLEQFSVKY